MSEAMRFISRIKKHKDDLPKQTIKTIRGQALAGDVLGAKKGLERLLNERMKCDECK
ncbi:MAG: hypothetical protein WCQ41_06305 [Bacillota bacterium]